MLYEVTKLTFYLRNMKNARLLFFLFYFILDKCVVSISSQYLSGLDTRHGAIGVIKII